MKIIIFSLLCVVIAITDPISKYTEANSTQLESKILNGSYVKVGYLYMASLQLDNVHSCSSSFFQRNFLLTTGECAFTIRRGMKVEKKNGTAVVGNLNLKYGQRVQILKIKYHCGFDTRLSISLDTYCDAGVIMLSDDVNYNNMEILELYKGIIDLRVHGKGSMLCGWGTLAENISYDWHLEEAEYSDNLHCMYSLLYSERICTAAIGPVDFRRKMICGQGRIPNQTIALGDLGSPLTKLITIDGKLKNCIVGVTVRSFTGRKGTFLRFIRSNFIFDEIQEIVKVLSSSEKINITSQTSSMTRPNKRPKCQ